MRIVSCAVGQTLRVGRIIARSLNPGDIICLFGDLGSGKTVLAKGIAQGLGIVKERVVSPSFVIMRQHLKARLPLFHFDLYRLERPEDILALAYEEYLYANGITVIEWADRLRYLLPNEFLKVQLFIERDSRRVLKFSAFGRRHRELMKRIHEDIRH